MILLMGLPGSGKGTQGKMLADHHGLHLISMGEIIRLYVTGKRRQQMLAGELLDDQEVIGLLDMVISSLPDNEECLLDGFPRTLLQAEWLRNQAQVGRFAIKQVINLAASHAAVKVRLLNRGRADDQEKVIEERFREYERLTQPLLSWFNEHNIKVENIDAERPANAVHADLIKLLATK